MNNLFGILSLDSCPGDAVLVVQYASIVKGELLKDSAIADPLLHAKRNVFVDAT